MTDFFVVVVLLKMSTLNSFVQLATAGHDSDSDVEEERTITNDRMIDPHWYEFSDEEETNETRVVLSKEQKSNNDIEHVIDELQFHTSADAWTDAATTFQQVQSMVEKHKNKYKKYCFPYLDFLKYSDFSDKVEGATKADFEKPTDLSNLKRLVQLMEEQKQLLKSEIDALDEEDDEENEDDEGMRNAAPKHEADEDHDEEYFADVIANSVNDKPRKAEKYENIASECEILGYEAAYISSTACVIDIFLEPESGKTSVPLGRWTRALDKFKKIFALIGEKSFIVTDTYKGTIKGNRCVVVGGLSTVLSKFWLALKTTAQQSSPSDISYLEIPYLENQLLEVADSLVQYYTSKNQIRTASLCSTVILEIVGYRRPDAHKLLFSKMAKPVVVVADDVVSTIRNIIRILFPYCNKTTKMIALCYLAYQLAMKGLYREGRDSLLRAGVRDAMDACEPQNAMELGTVYNRAVAQLGLAAFIAGDMYETYQLLGGVWSHDQPEVILGQKVPMLRNDGQEILFRDNLVPPHLNIPYQHLELAAMLSALVIDTTKEAKNPYDRNQRDHQKFFHQAITRRIPLIGVASTTQERIGAAYKALKRGDFYGAKENVESMNAWSSLPNGKEALRMYLDKLKESALRIFCLTNRCNFSTFSVSMLALKYDLPERAVKDVINQIISENDSLIAYWDRDEEYLFVDRSNTTRLQHLVIGTTNTVAGLGPYTERRLRSNEGRGGRGRGGRGRMNLRNK